MIRASRFTANQPWIDVLWHQHSIFDPTTYGLVGVWLNDANTSITADSFGSHTLTNHNAVVAGAALASGLGGSATFNGTNQYLSVASDSSLQAGNVDWAVAWWHKAANYTNGIAFVAKSLDDGLGDFDFGTDPATTGKLNPFIGNGTGFVQWFSSSPMVNGSVCFCMVWLDSVGQHAYSSINAQPVPDGTPLSGFVPAGTAKPFTIGAEADPTYFNNGFVSSVYYFKPPTPIGNGSPGTMANALITLLYNGGAGRKFPF